MTDAIFTETVIFRTTPEMAQWISEERAKLEADFGEGFNFADADVVRRVLFKQMRADK